jgi:ADP-ribosylglycohydrolase/uncharacterized protein YegL
MNISYHLDYETVVRGRSELVHLAILFRAAKQASHRSSPFAFGLVLDTSSSMDGRPLEQAKAAAQMVITHLGVEDRIGVVTFSDAARTIIPMQPAANKAQLKELIAGIASEGMTNLTAGWMQGRDEVTKAPEELPRKVLLLTDGQTNMGIVEPTQIRQIVAHGLEKERVRTSCLGFGDGYNEDLLNELSKAAGGAVHDADSPEKFPGIFQQELDSLLKLSAQNVRVRLKQLHYCTGVAIISDYPLVSLPEGGLELTLGDLVSEEERVLVFALEILPIPSLPDGSPAASLEGEALLEVEILYDEIASDGVISTTEQRTIRVLPVQSEADVKINETAIKWMVEQMAGRAISEAIAARDQGDAGAVNQRIAITKKRITRYGRPDLTLAAAEALENFEVSSRDWTARTRKASRMRSARAMRTSSFYAIEPPDHGRLDDLYEELKVKGSLAADFASLGNHDPLPANALGKRALVERFSGCLFGGAVGDALGRCVEGQSPGGKWIEEYQPWHGWRSGPKGTITDDTQLTIWLSQSMIAKGGMDPDDLMQRFTAEHIRGIGQATLEFVKNVKLFGKRWYECGVASAGNGVAMRSASVGLFYRDNARALKLGSILQAVITHNDAMAIASGILTAHAIALLLTMQPGDLGPMIARQAFCRRLAEVICGMEANGAYQTRHTREPATLEQRFRQDLPLWLEENLDPIEVNQRYWSGAYVLESLPHAFYCFLRSPEDFRQTLLQAVNSSRDSDTVAAIAGNLSGALNGVQAIPKAYLDELEYRRELGQLSYSFQG